MRIICLIFFTIVSFGIRKSTPDINEGTYQAVVDTKVVEYDENDEMEAERPDRKDRMKDIKNFVGTNLFGEAPYWKKCFSSEDIALLAARRDFESLMPKDLADCLLDDELAKILMQYFYGADQVIERMAGGHLKLVAKKAFYDTLGGYLKYYMIPILRYSYYAGLVKLRTVENILEIYNECKYSLNTNGNGWKAPINDFTDLDIHIEPLKIIVPNEEEDTSCIQLALLDARTGEDDDMIVALPRLDPEGRGVLGNVWLPFKRKRTFNLQSCMSAFVLLRYFELTTRCYNFQGICQDAFNKKFKDWILENLEIHFADDVLYPGLGAILRIVETLRRKTKGTVIIVPKTNSKRQEMQTYKSPRKNAKQSEIQSEGLLEDVFVSKDTDILSETYIQMEKDCRMKYIYIAISVAVIVLIIVFLAIALTICKRWRSTRSQTDKPPSSTRKTSWFGRKSHQDDEEVLLNSKKSLSHKKNLKKSCCSSETSPTESKCFGICSKKNSPAIIETSSMDSDSGRENKRKMKAHTPLPAKSKITKTILVDEKKRFSISKKKRQNDEKEKSQAAKGGILKK